MSDQPRKLTIGTIGHVDHGKTTLAAAISSLENVEKERGLTITGPRSLADAIIETTTNLKGKQLSARALRRAEARKLKPKYK